MKNGDDTMGFGMNILSNVVKGSMYLEKKHRELSKFAKRKDIVYLRKKAKQAGSTAQNISSNIENSLFKGY